MSNNTFDINVLVNGNRCKQYQHEGKTFVEAKHGSEYVIEIKNNYWYRIEAVAAVDGLDVLTGKAAAEDRSGYVIPAYSTEKIKGFRFSDDEWALFKFGYKMFGNTYAQSKQDDSEKNCGVIGVRLFYEYNPVMYTLQTQPIWYDTNQVYTVRGGCSTVYPVGTTGTVSSSYTTHVQYGCCHSNDSTSAVGGLYSSGKYGYNLSYNAENIGGKITAQNFSPNFEGQMLKGFDMGTEFGKREQSKVTTVSFSRGYLAHSLDIYYASRESLIEMGVPICNKMQISLPQSFPSKYAQPPKGWVG